MRQKSEKSTKQPIVVHKKNEEECEGQVYVCSLNKERENRTKQQVF